PPAVPPPSSPPRRSSELLRRRPQASTATPTTGTPRSHMNAAAVTVFEPAEIVWTGVIAAVVVGIVFTLVPATRTPARSRLRHRRSEEQTSALQSPDHVVC